MSIQEVVIGDSAELQTYLKINGQAVTADLIDHVQFTVQLPDTTESVVNGTLETDGAGFYRWLDTTEVGQYVVQARFYLFSGEIRSVVYKFLVLDPFNPPDPSPVDLVVDQVTLRLEDLFDSIEGGPWLRDQSLSHFDSGKIADFIPEALLDINIQMPPTNWMLDTFTASASFDPQDPMTLNPNMPLLVKGVLVLTIRHLMRSYVEQPIPQGGQIVWHDRTRYSQLWAQIYEKEYADYLQAVRLFKRTELKLGHAASLTFSKAGRLYPYGSQRSRGIWRGFA